MKTAKRILTVALALMLIFAMSAPSFAMVSANQPSVNGVPYYIQGSDSDYQMSGTFTVYLNIYSGIYDSTGPIDVVLPVTMGTSTGTNQLYTVSDVLAAAATQYTNMVFDTSTPDPLGVHADYLYAIKDTTISNNVWFETLPLHCNQSQYPYYCGWMFRINGLI